MERTLSIDTLKKVGKTVLLKGWVNTRRDHGQVVFLDLRDRSGLLQIVAAAKLAKNLHPQDIVEVEGKVVKRSKETINKEIATGTVEVKAEKIKLLAKAHELPFDMGGPKLKVELPTLLDHRSLTLRHPRILAIFQVQEVILQTYRQVLKEHGFTEISVPTIVATATEGGSEVFSIEYFKDKAFLAQSPQFYKQIMVSIFERVFTASHAYRAEPSVTTRHMTEYVGLDAEMGFINDWTEVIDMAETLVKAIFKAVDRQCAKQLKLYKATIPKTIAKTPRLKLKEALEIVYKRTKRDHRNEPDLDPEDEREICRWAQEEKGSEILFITHYPTKKRPMYTYPDPNDPEYTFSFDLIGRGVEWITGGQRINDYDHLVKNIKKWGCRVEDFENPYLQAFKYGMPPEGGFCLGLERITQNILGLQNIREATLFPRDMTRIDIRLAQRKKQTGSSERFFRQIKNLLDKNKVKYKVFEHKPVYTSEQAARVRGTDIKQGAKALVMFGDEKPVMLVVSAAYKIDTQKFKTLFKVKDLRMASKDEVRKITGGVNLGAVPPFGSLFDIPTFVDETLGKNKSIAFNAGVLTKSIEMPYSAWEKIVKPQKNSFHQ